MAAPFNETDPVRKTYFINESEKSLDPADDAGKVVQLEDDGQFGRFFVRAPIAREYSLPDSPATWTKPSGLKRVFVQLWAGGGSGGANTNAAHGGGGGGYQEGWIEADILGATETVTIGAGGASVSSISSGDAGGNTIFGSLLKAYGGKGGEYRVGAGNLGLGGDGGDIGRPLFAGLGSDNSDGIEKGGGGGGSTYIIGDGGAASYGGAGGGGASAASYHSGGSSSFGGDGGDGANGANAQAGAEKGGGGGGSNGGNSGKGGDGFARIIEFY